MKAKILNSLIDFIKKNKKYSNEDLEKIKYGLEGIYLTVTKLIIIIILSIILGILKELLILLFFFNIIRYFAFGFHANNSATCLITSTFLILGLTYLLINIKVNINIKILIISLNYINYLLFAPADTIKRPQTNKTKRIKRKILSIIILTIYSIIIINYYKKTISDILLVSIIIEGILINPITYKIYKMPYNNYKKV